MVASRVVRLFVVAGGARATRHVSRRGRRHVDRRVLRAIAASGPGIVLLHMLETIPCRLGRRGVAAVGRRISRCSRSTFGAATTIGASLPLDVRAAKAFLRERPEVIPSDHRHRRRVDWRKSRAARCRRRSGRAFDRAAVARDRLQGAAHRSGDEEVRRPARAARRQHEGSVCVRDRSGI